MGYDPEHHLESTVRELQSYVLDNINTRIYQVVMEFPGAMIDAMKMPMRKTIIHFGIDAQDDRFMWADPMTEEDNGDGTVTPRWAAEHRLNFDVGIWASDDSGGTTSRMRAAQILHSLFGYPASITNLRASSDGGDGTLDIIRYSGGMSAQDRVNDIRLYRMVNGELEIRVFSRSPATLVPPVPAIEDIVQAPNLTILG